MFNKSRRLIALAASALVLTITILSTQSFGKDQPTSTTTAVTPPTTIAVTSMPNDNELPSSPTVIGAVPATPETSQPAGPIDTYSDDPTATPAPAQAQGTSLRAPAATQPSPTSRAAAAATPTARPAVATPTPAARTSPQTASMPKTPPTPPPTSTPRAVKTPAAPPRSPVATPTPVISTSDSASGNALHCDVDSGSSLTDDERTSMLAACPAGSPAVCGTSLAARINETPAGGVLNLTGCSYTSTAININKAITIIGPTVSFPTANSWGDGVWLGANNITLDRWTFLSAGLSVGFASVQNIQILNSKFQGYTGGPIMMWGPVRNVLIEGNVFKNTLNVQSGFVGGRGNEGANPCPEVGRYVTIRENVGDQNTKGWFGIELKCFEDVLIERNSLKGGHALISLPDSNRITIRDNNLDLRGTAYWGVEVAKANDVRMENNTVQGDGTHTDAAFAANNGSVRSIVYRNVVINLNTLFAGPIEADVRWNCLRNVAFVTQFGTPETSTISDNNATC